MFETIKQLKMARKSLLVKEEKLILLYGSDDFLLDLASNDLEESLARKGVKSIHGEAKSETSESFEEKFLQSSLFEEKTAYFISHVEQATNFPKLLEDLSHKKNLTGPLILLSRKSTLPAPLKKQAKRLEALEVFCNSPKPFEQKDLTLFLCEREGLTLDSKALGELHERFTGNMVGLRNELQKLSLIKGRSSGRLSWSDIKDYIEGVREEEAFQLTSLLLEKRLPEAQAQITHLLHSGDHALSILGIIGYFCRTALYLKSKAPQSFSQKSSSSAPRLPNFIINRYNRHMHLHSEASLGEALKKCAEADLFLKSRGKSSQLIYLSDILLAL